MTLRQLRAAIDVLITEVGPDVEVRACVEMDRTQEFDVRGVSATDYKRLGTIVAFIELEWE